ncbi:phage tail tape measure protein [Ruminococcus sp.]|uniref:phage tail tape measure protein n=1 Tax=Ruminococcus sp. TaxID=41978 RepID=UPI003EFC22FC
MAYDGSIKIDTKVDTGGFSSGVEKMKSIASKGVSAMTTAFAAVTAGIAAGGTAAATVGSSFEAAMSKVSAISGSTGKDLQSLTDKAKEMGAKTKFSASESAEALQYMAMAGWDTKSMLDGIDGIMSLAAADGLDLATTSDIVTDALTAFGLKASDSTHFADVLAKASSSANTNVSMLGESFKYVAPLAGSMGYSVEDISVALGLMANASVKGSMAGTSLKTALSNMAAPTDSMAAIMTKYGISLEDANGKSKPLIDVLKQLREKFSGLSETEQTAAASTLFGKEAMSGMLAIINASDSDFKKLTENINNADGAAKSMADTMQDNLKGQITILKSALEGLGIEIYEGMQAPLKDAAIEAQGYVNRLTEAFTDGGLTGMIEEAGNIFGELAVKAAEYAPKMVDTSIKFVQSFVDGIAKNSDKLASAAVKIIETIISGVTNAAPQLAEAAKTIVSAIVDNLVKLLPSEIQKPVKDAVNTIKKSFEDGGIRRAINTVKTVLSNLAKVATNLAKAVLPPLAKVVDLVANNLDKLIPLAVSVYTAYKSWKIISTITSLITAHTAAVTAESLAEAASLGTITLKQIAVGALTGEITLATAAQYAWNAAMNANPIGIVITAVAALAAGIGAMSMTMGEGATATDGLKQAQEELATANENLGSSYEEIGNKFSDFYTEIENSGSIFDNFNEQILISDDEKQALADNMDSVQGEITEIARLAADERRELTGSEIQRLDELFQKMHELSEQELALEEAKQGVVTTQAKALNDASGISLEEYTQRSQKLVNSAEETRTAVIDKAYEQYTEEVALLDLRLQTDSEYSEKEHKADVEAAEKRYQDAINAANKEAGDTLAILQQGYYDRADALKESTDELKRLNNSEEDENHLHYMKMQDIQRDYNDKLILLDKENINQEEYNNRHLQLLYDKKIKEDEENSRNSNKIKEIRNDQQKILDDENYQNQLAGFMTLEGLYETYTGKTGEHSDNIVRAFFKPMENMPKDTKEKFQSAVDGAIKGLDERKDTLFFKATEIAGGFINTFKKMFNINSPSKVFKKIFKYTIEGGEVGVDDEAPKLYKQADDVASTFTKRMQAGISADGLVSKMKAAVSAGRAFVAQKLTANVVHEVELHNDDNDKKYFFKGDVVTHIGIDGREFAVVATPYVSEELAWEVK